MAQNSLRSAVVPPSGIASILVDLSQASPPTLQARSDRGILGQIRALPRIRRQIEKLLFAGVVEPDVLLIAIGDILHAVFMIITLRVFALNERPPVGCSAVAQGQQTLAVNRVGCVEAGRVEEGWHDVAQLDRRLLLRRDSAGERRPPRGGRGLAVCGGRQRPL